MNTAIGYKLFRVKKSEPGKIFPLYVYADRAIPIGEWLDAEDGPITENGKVKSRLGELAFRPGWHINDKVPYVEHIFSRHNGIKYLRDDCQWYEVEYITDINYQDEANEAGKNRSGKIVPVKAFLKHVPVNGFYRYKTTPMMYGEWIIAGSMRVIRAMSDDEVFELCSKYGLKSLPRYVSEP